MKKIKVTATTFFLVIVLLTISAFRIGNPCDAPLVGGHTGAPGETSCTGCHGGTDNTGPANINFNIDGPITVYNPGQVYTITVSMAQTGIDKMGFAALALKDQNNTTIGTFSLIEPGRTRLFADGNRDYVSHTPCAADAASLGVNQWTFAWQAPMIDAGPITLYLGALAANHNHSTTGDFSYTKSIQLSSISTLINENNLGFDELQLFPNPILDGATLSYENVCESNVTISILDKGGRVVKTLLNEKQLKGKHKVEIERNNLGIPKGLYFLHIENEKGTMVKKMLTL